MLCLVSCSAPSHSSGAGTTSTTVPPTLTLAFRPVEATSSASPCRSPLVADGQKPHLCYRLGPSFLGLADIDDAESVFDESWLVELTVTAAAEPRFVKAMQGNVGRDVAIVVNGTVLSALRVDEGIIGRNVTLSGSFDEATADRIAAGLRRPRAPDPRQHDTVCTSRDMDLYSGPPLPPYHRLADSGTYWFGHVHLEPPPPAAKAPPLVSEAQAWGTASGDFYVSGVYEVVLADWTSDAGIVMQGSGQPAPHDHVFAWVVIGTHVPIDAGDVSEGDTVPGVPCYFGTSIAAVDARTGRPIASATDYHR